MAGRTMTVSDSVLIAADALELYSAVADPSQMPRWSPENTGATVPHPGRPLPEGASFVGTNQRGRARWSTRCVVTHAEPGRRFSFVVGEIGLRRPVVRGRIARWDWRFEEVVDGTLVTETWTDGRRRWPDRLAAGFDRVVTGGRTFPDFQRRNIARTLARLKADFEGGTETA
ncbi:SRPBCC family protein [Nocardioides sp. CFH 31398]|uniref:SRPBCC family protein n=1 Tax=Nocardioides sp. CFH 31398 TaxID=2919579 RepID=UPI001F067BDB|nr:SRPBCC family protein [Nocardioides sp. CFH 31398]MCH1865614.1 SRPBCC family protein [Nocardioides sp. CFH 31398]